MVDRREKPMVLLSRDLYSNQVVPPVGEGGLLVGMLGMTYPDDTLI